VTTDRETTPARRDPTESRVLLPLALLADPGSEISRASSRGSRFPVARDSLR